MAGNAPIYAILREARDRATAAGATNVEEKAIVGAPVDALVDLAIEVKADLLVVGNVGLSTIAGRLLGSVPANVARRSQTDVLIVHTTPEASGTRRLGDLRDRRIQCRVELLVALLRGETSVNAREKLAMTPLLRASFSHASSRL